MAGPSFAVILHYVNREMNYFQTARVLQCRRIFLNKSNRIKLSSFLYTLAFVPSFYVQCGPSSEVTDTPTTDDAVL